MVNSSDQKASNKNQLVKPFLKWAGGKSQLLSRLKKFIPRSYTTYYEPFVGGGALFFSLQPESAVINDSSEELINVYRVIRDHLDELIEDLRKHVNDEKYFYKIRSLDRNAERYAQLSAVEKASRIIFLNKTCYNGLFRVNKRGQFNAPYGYYKNPNIVNEPVLRAVSRYLNRAEVRITCGDFEASLENIKEGSFVYLDPPYDPLSDSANFTEYDKGGFDRSEQLRLKKTCDRLDKLGVKFLLSNSATEFIKDLYRDYKCEIIPARRSINANGRRRGEVEEILVRNYA